jgi:phosphohistidine swiveling domain-containing protein
LGGDFTVHFCFYDDGKADWYILMDDINKVTNAVIEASKNNSDIGKDFIKTWQKDQDLFYKKSEEIRKIKLKELSDKELIRLHDEYAEIILDKNSSSSLIDGFALGTDQMMAEMIKKVYENSKIKDKMRLTEVFSLLTAPIHLSFINEAEIELLKIALKIKENNINKEESSKLIREHQKKFFWIRNNYVTATILDEKYFQDEINKLLDMKLDIKEEINKIENTPKKSKLKKAELMNQLNLSQELKTLIKISEDFTYWQDERKRSTFWITHYFSLILEEIGKRIGIDKEYLKYMTCRETSLVFENKPNLEELKARRKNGVYYWDKTGMEALSMKEADRVRKEVLGETNLEDIDDFRGLTACLGKAIGKVKIVKSATEISKVEKGDILVAVMTRPDYVPAMKKASAIVTDEGGVTCHAAIVSRELGIPCIIATKIATKVLKDNQLVEVNANHGWIKIIKQENKK